MIPQLLMNKTCCYWNLWGVFGLPTSHFRALRLSGHVRRCAKLRILINFVCLKFFSFAWFACEWYQTAHLWQTHCHRPVWHRIFVLTDSMQTAAYVLYTVYVFMDLYVCVFWSSNSSGRGAGSYCAVVALAESDSAEIPLIWCAWAASISSGLMQRGKNEGRKQPPTHTPCLLWKEFTANRLLLSHTPLNRQSWHVIACSDKIDCSRGMSLLVVTT